VTEKNWLAREDRDLEDWERYGKNVMLEFYAEKNFDDLFREYCHENFHAWEMQDGSFEGGVCSIQEKAPSLQELRQKVADKIAEQLRLNILGC
jgi:hypothetical protein